MKKFVDDLIKKYGTRDPYELAEKNGIEMIVEDLGDLEAYYNKAFDKKFIHLNSRLRINRRKHSAAVILYHALTDSDRDIVYRTNVGELRYGKLELEALMFAATLMDYKYRLMSYNTLEESLIDDNVEEEDREAFYEWVREVTENIDVRKYKEDDLLNRTIYMVEHIENLHSLKGGGS